MTQTSTATERPAGPTFEEVLAGNRLSPLRARALVTMQVNLGKLCNQACAHCHVDAGPKRTGVHENMQRETAELVLEVLARGPFTTLDLTGGAPELNPNFRFLVEGARRLGVHVMDRCNLTVLFEAGQEDLADFLAAHEVEVVASLPYWTAERTDRQRGPGVFERSLSALRLLNEKGYGLGRGLVLDLVYNPCGAFLPGPQDELEAEFKERLLREHGIRFDRLFALANLPIHRFLGFLVRSGNEQGYRARLAAAFNPAAAENVMCRDLISVAPDGRIYDCDFNQMLELAPDCAVQHLRDFDAEALRSRRIRTGRHCFGCTAGQGSSCGGATAR